MRKRSEVREICKVVEFHDLLRLRVPVTISCLDDSPDGDVVAELVTSDDNSLDHTIPLIEEDVRGLRDELTRILRRLARE